MVRFISSSLVGSLGSLDAHKATATIHPPAAMFRETTEALPRGIRTRNAANAAIISKPSATVRR
jgi:hypothetical protein